MYPNNSRHNPSLSPALLTIILAFFFCISAVGAYLFVDACVSGPRSIVGRLGQREYSHEEMVDVTDCTTNGLFSNLDKSPSDGLPGIEKGDLTVRKIDYQSGQVLNEVIFKLPPNQIQ